MTKEVLLQALRVQAFNGDPEDAHGKADDLLLAYIDDAEIRAAYDKIKRWYA